MQFLFFKKFVFWWCFPPYDRVTTVRKFTGTDKHNTCWNRNLLLICGIRKNEILIISNTPPKAGHFASHGDDIFSTLKLTKYLKHLIRLNLYHLQKFRFVWRNKTIYKATFCEIFIPNQNLIKPEYFITINKEKKFFISLFLNKY